MIDIVSLLAPYISSIFVKSYIMPLAYMAVVGYIVGLLVNRLLR